MLTVTFGLALTLVLVAKATVWGKRHGAELGTMSEHWVQAHHASQPASST